MDVAGSRPQNGPSLTSTNCSNMGAEGKRKRGRPRETWRRTIEGELKENGLGTWAAAASAAEDKPAWRQRAYGPILHLENG